MMQEESAMNTVGSFASEKLRIQEYCALVMQVPSRAPGGSGDGDLKSHGRAE